MPSVVRLRNGRLLAALRRRIGGSNRWTDVFVSPDEGLSWEFRVTLERGGGGNNPMSLVLLQNGRVAAVYGNRREGELGIRYEKDRFGGWPANHGIWSWESEILIGFGSAWYADVAQGHAVDRTRPEEHLLARSRDGGMTWALEHPNAQGALLPRGKNAVWHASGKSR